MAAEPQTTRTLKPEPGWELVLKRNPVERLKQEKHPLGIRDELPALIAAGYESVAEEDIVRLQWWGLYHDKPKVGTFMLRIKLPSGHLTPAKLRAIGEVSNKYGKGAGELATRQNIQLHYLKLSELPDVFADLDKAGITTAGGCGDTVRNITGCPVQGLDPDERFEARLGRTLEDYEQPPVEAPPHDHLGIHRQKQEGLVYIGVPVHLGLISGDQMIQIADLAEHVGADVRITRLQNF